MPFTIISVTGAHSSVGKTSLCALLLNNLKDFGAIKYTKSTLFTSITDDETVILQGNKDTAVMSRSGAKKVVWIKSGGRELEDTLNIALSKMENQKGVVIEGNSPCRHVAPDLIIFVAGTDGEIKPSAKDICREADVVLINSADTKDSISFLQPLMHKKTKIFWVDLIKKEGEIDKFLRYIKKYIKG